jgi:hypothetical protein
MNSSMKIAAMVVLSCPLALGGCMAAQADDEMEQSVAQAEQVHGMSGSGDVVQISEVEQGGGGGGCVAPRPEVPGYTAPSIPAPSYPAPSFGAPRHSPPVYKAPVYQSPTYQQGGDLPIFDAPRYAAPSYQGPTFAAPVYEAPTYDAPTFYAPIFEGPTYLPLNDMLAPNPAPPCSMGFKGQCRSNP